MPFTACGVFDVEARYKQFLEHHLGAATELHLGCQDGDVTRIDPTTLKGPIDFVCSGPPCPPWAGNGKKLGPQDERADVFISVVKLVVYCVKIGWLLGCIIENVAGTVHTTQDNGDGFMYRVQRALQEECSEFVWEVVILNARDYRLAQNRCRVFLRGMRTSFCGPTVPPVAASLGKLHLADFLDASAAATPVRALTPHMKTNLRGMEKRIRFDREQGKLEGVNLVVMALDRSLKSDAVFKARYMQDMSPTLTCSNKYLFIISVDDVCEKAPRFRRFLLPQERLLLQGFSSEVYEYLENDNLAVKAAGNAYPVPLLAACLKPMVEQLGAAEGLYTEWPRTTTPMDCTDTMQRIQNMLKTPQQMCKRRAAAAGLQRTFKRPAASSSSSLTVEAPAPAPKGKQRCPKRFLRKTLIKCLKAKKSKNTASLRSQTATGKGKKIASGDKTGVAGSVVAFMGGTYQRISKQVFIMSSDEE